MKTKALRLLSVFCALSILIVAIPVTVTAETLPTTGIAASDVALTEDKTLATILEEKTDLRQENVKYFRCDDGTILAAMYDRPVHYYDGDGWEDIDNTLTATTVKNVTYYSNQANSLKVHLPSSLQNTMPVCVENGEFTLQWVMLPTIGAVTSVIPPIAEVENIAAAPAAVAQEDASFLNEDKTHLPNQHSRVNYTNVYSGVDVRYDVIGDKLKESIVLNALPTQMTFSFQMQAAGLTAALQADKSVHFYAADEQDPVFVIEAPYMMDANGEYSEDIAVSLVSIGDDWQYTLTPSRAWLADSERAYPITIDPTVDDDNFQSSIEATNAYSRYTTSTYQNKEFISAGSVDAGSAGIFQYESFLQFELPDMLDANHVDLQVVSAKLKLHSYTARNKYADNEQIDLYRVLSAWSESTLSWDTRPQKASLITDAVLGDKDKDTDQFDITALVNGWVDGTYANHGVALVAHSPSTTAWDAVCWHSEDSTTASKKPTVQISYRECKGLEDYWTYTSLSVGRGAVASVNNATGVMTAVIPDCGIDGNRMPVSISHVYNSDNTSENIYGGKWRLNYQMSVAATGLTDYPYYFTDGDGTAHYFKVSGEKMKDEDGLGLTLTVNDTSTDEKYVITAKDKSKMLFNSDGNLRFIRDTNDNEIEIVYDTSGRIGQIIDGADRVYQLAYNAAGTLSSITDPAGRQTWYGYNGDGNAMSSVNYPDGGQTAISYLSGNIRRLAANGQTIVVTHASTGKKRVSYMELTDNHETAAIESYTFSYKTSATKITDLLQNTYVYQFNPYLHTVCIVNEEDGSAQSYTYGKPGGTTGEENKTLTASDLQKPIVNYAKNGASDDLTETAEENTTLETFTATGSTVSRDATKGHIGVGSIRVVETDAYSENPLAYASQTYTVDYDGYCTVSAYVTLSEAENANFDAVLDIERKTSGGAVFDTVRVVQDTTAVDEWVRISNTVPCQSGNTITVKLGARGVGTAWFDDVQIEKNETTNNYNMLRNATFKHRTTVDGTTYISDWSPIGSNWTRTTNSILEDADYSMRAPGSMAIRRLGQAVVVSNGKKGDTFSFGGWGKADSCFVNVNSTSSTASTFSILLNFVSGDTSVGATRVSFNPFYNAWQFASGAAVAPADYDQIQFFFEYSGNVNQAWFTLPYVYKDNYGQSFTYENGNLVSATDKSAGQSTYAYDDDQLSKLASPTGSVQFARYDPATNNLKYLQTTDGQRYEYAYDSYGNAISANVYASAYDTEPVAGKSYFIRNAFSGNCLAVSDVEAGATVLNRRWTHGAATQLFELVETDKSDEYRIRPISAAGENLRLAAVSGTNNFTLAAASTSNGQVFKLVKNDNGTFTIQSKYSNFAKCIDGQPGDSTNTNSGSAISHLANVTEDSGQQWYLFPYVRDYSAHPHFSTSATYTEDGNYLATSTDQLGNVTTQETDARGNITTVTSSNGVKTTYGYDTHGVHNTSVSVSQNDTTLGTVNYTYSQDRLTSILAPGGTRYTLTYDTFGRSDAVYIGDATGRMLSQSTYNNVGLLEKLQYGNGISANYEYDTLGRQTKLWYSDYSGSGIETIYNAYGQVGMLLDYASNTRLRYSYDLAGRLDRVQKGESAYVDLTHPSADIRYLYEDGTNHLIASDIYTDHYAAYMRYEYGDIEFDEMPDIIYSLGRGYVTDIQYTYDSLGRLTRRRNPLAMYNVDYTYTDIATEAGKTTSQIASVNNDGVITSYTYDMVGNITSETTGNQTIAYTYDALNQLIGVTGGDKTYAYTYDGNGNLLTAQKGSVTNTYTYGDTTWKDLLTAYNGQTITYDEIGNPLTYRDGITFTWKNGRKLATMTKNDVTTVFDYNESGGRRMKMVGETPTFYQYVDGVLYAQYTGDDVLAYTYDDKGVPYMVTHMSRADVIEAWGNGYDIYALTEVTAAGDHYYYQYNMQGDVVGLMDIFGNQVARYTYDPWGLPLSVTDANGNAITSATHIANLNPIRYRGYHYDTETGLYYLNSRYYDPVVGRFISADGYLSTGQGMTGYNMFAYCGNNSVNRADPSGESSIIIGGVILEKALKWFLGLFVAYLATDALVKSPPISIPKFGVIPKSDAKTDEKEETKSFPKTKEGSSAVFYGADMRGGNWKIVTGAMSYQEAKLWVGTSSACGVYGKNSSWGLYTQSASDASSIAWDFGKKMEPIYHPAQPGKYPHYHVNNFLLFDKHKHFHIWYGEKG